MGDPVLVTGARGRVGAAIAAHLEARNREVVRFSRSAGDGCQLLDDLLLGGWLSRPVTLIHCAWSTVPKTSEMHPGIEWDVDLPLLWKILRAIGESDDPARCRLLFLSSGGTVYGNAGERPSQESDPLAPVGWHGFAKVAAEGIIARFAEQSGLRETRVRLSNPFGFVGTLTKPQGVIPYLVRAAMDGTRFNCWGDGSATKDYIALPDLLEGLGAILDSQIEGPINLCSGRSFALDEIRQIVERETGRQIECDYHTAPGWDVTDSRLDPTLLARQTGWSARHELNDSIRHLIDEMRYDGA